MKLRTFFLLLFKFQFLWLCSQEPFFWQYTDEDGLPSMTVYQILQDRKGFIWVGTESGLCRFDGKEFKPFDTSRLTDTEILKMQEDEEGKIWFRNLSGQMGFVEGDSLQLYQPDTLLRDGKVNEFQLLPNEKKLLFYVYPSQDNFIEQVIVYRNNQKVDFDSPDFAGIGKINLDQNGNILFSGLEKRFFSESSSIYFVDKTLSDIKRLNATLQFKERTFFHVFPFSPDTLVLYTDYGEVSIFIDKHQTNFLKLTAKIHNLSRVDDHLWITTENGVFIYENLSESKPKLKEHILKGYSVNGILRDRENNFWIITSGSGILFSPNFDSRVFTKQNSTFSSDQVFSLHHDDLNQRLWIGLTDGQVCFLNYTDRKISSIKTKLSGRILFFENNTEWLFAGGDGGITKFKSKQLNDQVFFNKIPAKSMIIDHENNLWLGMVKGITSLPAKFIDSINLSPLDLPVRNSVLLIGTSTIGRTYALCEDFEKRTWIGSTKGIYYVSNENDAFFPFLENGKHQPYRVSNITQDFDSTLWIGTHGDGLLKLRQNEIIDRISKEDGLVSNMVKCLFVDSNKQLWIGTDNGLNILNLQSEDITYIDKTKGLPSNDINAIIAHEKETWIGTSKGLTNIPSKTLTPNYTNPLIHINAFKIWEKDTSLQETYVLSHLQNNLNIEFIGLAYRMKGEVTYQYRLIGLDSTWVSTTSAFARYPLLIPGNYEFQVVAVNEDGFNSSKPAIIEFEILPPFWQTWWFRIGSILIAVFVLWLVFYLRFKRIQQREREQQAFKTKVNELRMQALQTQMNPHFIFNALNAIQQYITTNDQETAMIYLARFARLIRLIFEQSKRKEISLEEELEFLNLYLNLEKLRFGEKINIDLNVDQKVHQVAEDWKLPPLLIQPIIENAFKHGLLHKKGSGELKISFEIENSRLKCTIEDDGIGRKRSKEINSWRLKNHESSGLKSTKERLKILSQQENSSTENFTITDLFNEKNHPIGTRVEIFIK